MKKSHQNKKLKPGSDSIRAERLWRKVVPVFRKIMLEQRDLDRNPI